MDTTVILSIDPTEHDLRCVKDVNRWLYARNMTPLRDLNTRAMSWFGPASPPPGIFIAIIIDLNADAFMGYLAALDWEMPGCLQLMIRQEGDPSFLVHVFEDRAWVMLDTPGDVRRFASSQ